MQNFYKKFFITMVALCVLPIAGYAQQISVVDPIGQTTVYTDLNVAIYEAPAGSMVYLSGGGFSISDTSKIKKPLTIMGIGHRFDNDNADGSTIVSGNIYFYPGSDGSALLGIHLTGGVGIGSISMSTHASAGQVNNILVRYCDVKLVSVGNGSNCLNVHINQNYIREGITGGQSPIYLSNNICQFVMQITAGVIEHNVFTTYASSTCFYDYVQNSQVKNNINIRPTDANAYICSCTNTVFSNNMVVATPLNLVNTYLFGDNCYSSFLSDAFVGTAYDVNPVNDFHLKETCVGKNAATDGTDIGIYGGTGFSDKALPPGPRIIFKKVAHQTDHDGNLPVEIKVSVE